MQSASDAGRRACIVVLSAALVTLVAVVAWSDVPLRYDEPWYLNVVDLLRTHGLSREFLVELPGPAGPLHALIHAAAAPLTKLSVPGVRLVNVGLLLATVAVLAWTLRTRGSTRPWIGAGALVGLPSTWVLSGLALTEAPAMFFASLGVGLLLLALSRPRGQALALGACAGLMLGLAIAGRQPFLLVLLAAPLLLLEKRSDLRVIGVFLGCAAALPTLLFVQWGGLVPPRTAWVAGGISVLHAALALSYAAILAGILAPRWFEMKVSWALLAVGCAAVANSVWPLVRITPSMTAASRILGSQFIGVYTWLASTLMLGFGTVFAVATAQRAWENRRDAGFCFVLAAATLVLGSNAAITHTFSSRYVAMTAPLLIVVMDRYARDGWFSAARWLAGAGLGLVSLAGYYLWL